MKKVITKVTTMIEATINAQTVDYLPEEMLARMLKNMEFSEKYMVHVFNFFTDVPLQRKHDILPSGGIHKV
ncbi:MAG: hypothetical protein ACPLQP_03280 [Moorellaceae bacterium]